MTELKPVPAATVALVRENHELSDLEVLLLQRNASLVFLGGHWVFPGGRLDPEDFQGGQDCLEYPAARRAAVRETREEAGIDLDPEGLVPIAHWTTPPRLPRRFSTWFFLYPVTTAVEVVVDNNEILDFCWLTPRQALAEARQNRLELARPTASTVAELARHRSLAEVIRAFEIASVRVYPEDSPYYRPLEMGYS